MHIVADIGDVHLQRPISVVEPIDPYRIVEIARGFAIDSDDIEIAKIASGCQLLSVDLQRNGPGLFESIVRKFMRDVMGANQDLDIDAEIAGAAQNFGDSADRALTVFAKIEN